MLSIHKLHRLCKSRGIAVTKLAEIVGESDTVTDWRNGDRPPVATVKKIAEYFQVSVDYLLDKPAASIDTDTSDFNRPVYAYLLKTCNGDAGQAIEQYMDFEKAQARDAMADPDRLVIYQSKMTDVFSSLSAGEQTRLLALAKK